MKEALVGTDIPGGERMGEGEGEGVIIPNATHSQ